MQEMHRSQDVRSRWPFTSSLSRLYILYIALDVLHIGNVGVLIWAGVRTVLLVSIEDSER